MTFFFSIQRTLDMIIWGILLKKNNRFKGCNSFRQKKNSNHSTLSWKHDFWKGIIHASMHTRIIELQKSSYVPWAYLALIFVSSRSMQLRYLSSVIFFNTLTDGCGTWENSRSPYYKFTLEKCQVQKQYDRQEINSQDFNQVSEKWCQF